ncbi:hypothetical protein N7519_003464 [Penicillium mononematosum]|uniref:uncharacterized protein n=1 Tax=Penicillium mononematosum TaxID=268346 RepID=UPI0025494564|nr:uncharacterized protein N7519_003464 [Penicillium mononematosum]KAJ6188556.1 hypothetical protein N7519_003464 [Penicillium mononematosum]
MGHEDIASFFLQSAPPDLLNDISISGWYSMLRPCRRDEVPYSCPSPWGKPHLAQMILDRVNLETQLATTTAPEQANLLAVAAQTGNVALTQRLLDKGCRPDLSNMRLTPVSRAVNNGHAEIIEACLRCPGYPVSQFDIASAAKKGETATVLRLLDKLGRKDYKSFAKVALNAASHLDKFLPVMESVFDALYKKDVKTVISMATSFTGPETSCVGHLEVTKFLLEKGRKRPFDEIPKTLSNDVGKSLPRSWSTQRPFAQLLSSKQHLRNGTLNLIQTTVIAKDALVAAALHKKVETIRLFIERGFDVKSTYLHRGKLMSLLHLVVETPVDDYGRVIDMDDEKAQLLIEHGAEIDQVDSHGRTALFLATEIRTLVLARELLELGANPVFSRPGKVSPLELAISQGQTKYVKAFLKAMEARSFACDNFVSLIPDVPPVEMLPNRASHDRFSVSSRNLLPQRGMLARDGHMGPTITIPSPSGEIDRRDSTSSEDISTDDETIRAGPPTSEDNFLSIWSATEDDECVGDLRWVRFFIAKAMTQHHWRMMYPVPV